MPLRSLTLRELTIEDKPSFEHVGLYRDLERILVEDVYRFRVPAARAKGAYWGRVLFLNLTFWSAAEPNDVLVDDHIPADVVAHAAWHHLARHALAEGEASLGADGLFLGESIASAFDLYLVGRLLGHAPDSAFLETQVPQMAEAAEDAGMDADAFEELLAAITDEPERAFEDMRQLLFDAATALVACEGVDAAAAALEALSDRRFAPLLHHFELSNWVLYARAYAPNALAPDPRVRSIDASLRAAPVALDWLEAQWIRAREMRAARG